MKTKMLMFVFCVSSFANAQECKRPWVFFDLGETLIATYINDEDKSNDYKNMKYLPGALEYLQELEKLDYPIGLLVDVPEEWGTEFDYKAKYLDTRSAKIRRTMDFVAGKVPADDSSWSSNPNDPKMDWHFFGKFFKIQKLKKWYFKGRILLPQNNSERKASGSTVLFERARDLAKAEDCKALYIGEHNADMPLAKKAGVISFHGGDWPGSFFLPVEKIEEYIHDHDQ